MRSSAAEKKNPLKIKQKRFIIFVFWVTCTDSKSLNNQVIIVLNQSINFCLSSPHSQVSCGFSPSNVYEQTKRVDTKTIILTLKTHLTN